jgi:hypothetical protein
MYFAQTPEFSYDDIHRALKWHLPVAKILGAWRLLSPPNPGDELLESLHLGAAAELFPGADFLDSSPRLSVESSVNKANQSYSTTLSFREFRACESLS